MKDFIKIVLIAAGLFVIVLGSFLVNSCEAEYRYACQNPQNWYKDICKPPICELERDCPDLIFGDRARELLDNKGKENE